MSTANGQEPQEGADRRPHAAGRHRCAEEARRRRLRDPDRRLGGLAASQAQGRQRGDPGRHGLPPGRARRRARHDGGGAPRRRLRRGRGAGAQQAQDPADDHRHRQLGVGGRACHVHAARLGAAHQASTTASCARAPGASASPTCRPTSPASRSWWSAWAASARARSSAASPSRWTSTCSTRTSPRPTSRRPAPPRSPTSRRSCPRSTSSRCIARSRPRR